MKEQKANIAVLVSGGGTNLQALIDAQNNGIIESGEIRLVISNKPGAYALCRAGNAGIKTEVIDSGEISREEFEQKLTETLSRNKIDLIILAGFMLILSKAFVSKYKNRIINVHPSLIPSFCGEGFYGLRVHKAALDYGVKVTGATVHFVNEIADGGKIIMQKPVKIRENDTPESLQKRVMRLAEWKILPLAAEKVCKQISEESKNGKL